MSIKAIFQIICKSLNTDQNKKLKSLSFQKFPHSNELHQNLNQDNKQRIQENKNNEKKEKYNEASSNGTQNNNKEGKESKQSRSSNQIYLSHQFNENKNAQLIEETKNNPNQNKNSQYQINDINRTRSPNFNQP